VPPAVEGVRTAGFRGPSVATVRRLVSVGITFHLVLLAWVFFRANSLPDALVLLEAMTQFDGAASLSAEIASVSNFDVALSVSVIGMLLTVQMFDRNRSIWARLAEAPRWVRWGAYQALLLAIFLLGVFSQQQFIYFQF
jgi:hypothetical protein